jgi:signal transduction histidine kinase/HAMP domain-containing protein
MQVTTKLIERQINSLQNDLKFLSSLDVMDDILADDIDKKISHLLEQKAKGINKKSLLFFIDNNATVIASSQTMNLLQTFYLKEYNQPNGYYIQDNSLIFYAKVFASFDNTKELGYLVLKYDLQNLNIFLSQQKSIHSYILNAANSKTIGKQLNFKITLNENTNHIINNDYVIVYNSLKFFPKHWYLVYAVDKSTALATLYDFTRFMTLISVLIFFFVLFLSLKYAKEIIKPIEELTEVTNEITKTQDYSRKLLCHSNDEIQLLSNAFNTMLQTTSSALKTLEEENKRRLNQYTQLINVFNTIIQTQDEKECIARSISEIKLLTDRQKLYFQKEKLHNFEQQSIDLYVTNFQSGKKIYYGSIALGFNHYYDVNEQKLYNAIAKMVTLQLERIRLINNTLSVSKAKSAFISNMSHELRTPLNSIISATQFMISYEDLSDEQQDTIANIESSAHYLLEMINGILDIAKIEAGKMDVKLEEVNIIELVKNSTNLLLPLLQDKGLKFKLNAAPNAGKMIKTDPKIVQQILINLLSNAIKFTEKGSITVDIYTDDKKSCISIRDTGIGIEEKYLNTLFNDFTQVENIMQKKHKGTGLGLSLSKKMAHLLGGDIKITSEGLGEGVQVVCYL